MESLVLTFIIVLGSFLRLISLNQNLWFDEAINVLAVKNYSFLNLITQYAKADFHPPGWFIILWAWTKIFGYSEISVRILPVIFGVATIFFIYLIGKKLFSKKIGLIAALLLAINPLHIYYSQDARMYALATLAVSINIFLLIKLIKGEKVRMFTLILSNILILFSDYLAYFIFPAQLVILIICKKDLLKKWFISLISAVALGIWWLPTFINQLDEGAVASANLPTWKFIVGGFDFKTIPLTFVKFIIGRISLEDKTLYAIVLVPVVGLFSFLLIRSLKSLDKVSKIILICWTIIPIIIATLLSLYISIYSYFRLLFIIPGFIILVSMGIVSFKGKLRNLFLVIVILIELFCSFTYLLNPAYQREHWRELVNFFKKEAGNSYILFESSGTFPAFDYYANGQLNSVGALKDFPAKKEEDVIDLENLLKGSQQVFFVEYLVDISDPQRLVQNKLSKLSFKEDKKYNFTGVGFVYHYVKE